MKISHDWWESILYFVSIWYFFLHLLCLLESIQIICDTFLALIFFWSPPGPSPRARVKFKFLIAQFYRIVCLEMWNKQARKYLLPNIAGKLDFLLPKALHKKCVLKVKKLVTYCRTPPPLKVSRIIWMAPQGLRHIIRRVL